MISDRLAEDEYYHATYDFKAIQIFYEGFRLKKIYCPFGRYGTFQQAIYLTKSLATAAWFGSIVFRCRLEKGVSVLRIDESYDQKVIDYLKREFGKELLTGDISKAIPQNKNLTRKEVINLVNYRFKKMGKWKREELWKWYAVVSSIRQQLQRHKYDAVGQTDDIVGLAVFNPSYVEPLEHYHRGHQKENPTLQVFDKKLFVTELNETIVEMKDDYDIKREQEDWGYLETLLNRYCQENGLEKK